MRIENPKASFPHLQRNRLAPMEQQPREEVIDVREVRADRLNRIAKDVCDAISQAGGQDTSTLSDGSVLLVEHNRFSGKVNSASLMRDGKEVAALALSNAEGVHKASARALAAIPATLLLGAASGLMVGSAIPGFIAGGVLVTAAVGQWLSSKLQLGSADTLEYRAPGYKTTESCKSPVLEAAEQGRQQALHQLGWQIADRSQVELLMPFG